MAELAASAAEKNPAVNRSMRTGKRICGVLLKTALAGGLIYWLFKSKRLDYHAFLQIEITPWVIGLIGLAVGGVFLGQLLLALRLLLLLKAAKVDVTYGRVLGVTLIGSFFSAVLPGLVGGDVVRALYLCSDAVGKRANAVGTVIADRALGFYSLFLLGTIAWAAAWCVGAVALQNPALWTAPVLALGATVGLALIAALPRYAKWAMVRAAWNRVPANLQNLLQTLHDCLSRPGLLTVAVLLSLVNHSLVIATYLAAAILLGDTLPWYAHFVLSPLATVLNMVALTPGGIGLTEGAFSLLYESAGSAKGASVGLIGRIIQYLSFTVSGLVALFGMRIRSR